MSTVIKLFLIVGTVGLLLFGCSSNNESKTDADDSSLSPKDAELAALLNDALIRLSYEDKSGLYEFEFDYFTDETNYDEYLKRADIAWIHMDSLDHLDVHDIVYFDDDSAHASVEYVFNSAAGGQSRLPDRFTIFRDNDRWVKPTITTLHLQEEYERTIREAEAAAEEEN